MQRKYRAASIAALAALALMLSVAEVTAGVYGDDTGGVGWYRVPGSTWDGLAGFQMLKPLTPRPGHAISHPGQLNPTFTEDFLGFGTYKGLGTSGGITNCPTYTGSGWNVYVDGAVYGQYFCLLLGNVPGSAKSQSFIVRRHTGTCAPYLTDPGWDVLWQGVTLACVSGSFSSADALTAGAENVLFYPGEAIGVTYVQLQYRAVGTSFHYWPSHQNFTDPGYSITRYKDRTDSFTVSP